jgi:hypothetical protein
MATPQFVRALFSPNSYRPSNDGSRWLRVVDDLAEAQKKIEAAGGPFFFHLGDERHGNFERKFKDPRHLVFDISKTGWIGADGRIDSQRPSMILVLTGRRFDRSVGMVQIKRCFAPIILRASESKFARIAYF